MSVFQSVTIDNYRGIKHLELKDLKPINLLVGKNNSGKTSVLEALCLLCNMSLPQTLFFLNIKRGIDERLIPDSDPIKRWKNVKYSFNDFDVQNKIHIAGIAFNGEGYRDLNISAIEELVNGKDANANREIFSYLNESSLGSILEIRSINNAYTMKKGKEKTLRLSKITYHDGKISTPENYTYYNIFYDIIHVDNSNMLIESISQLEKRNKINELVNVLNSVDQKVQDIAIGFDDKEMILVDYGLPEKMLLNAMGEGMIRIALIVSRALAIREGVLAVDEIDTGLHYSALTTMWEAVIQGCLENGTQLFATTHSDECIKALNVVLQEKYHGQDIARLIRLEAGKDQHYASNFTTDIMDKALEMKLEVR